ncbi:MAG: beta-ketoacyl-[acyl-carrier-protein] synthase family protein [Gemmatales bacterium]|nr:beta-ketoacyl-[acyl-carrier-protein] synthase family protein [Gemmatales bacterium]MCS7161677.1 beta-ketoacyl-[acyl-carrier-protein] synthase family protein [Gemmatales bacterium]MDW8176880.1 beta-ketoacyl-[acyl-carrier-protein] synthase family protein [Gemmatales bacterium]MDW8221597.1 beta-ketoacyl-[acyl-carrier-protein] synthase family protein [Gemmatales bacterium]
MEPRVVITGIGLLTPLGLKHEVVWQNLQAGRSGVRRIQAFDPSALPTQIAGEITDFDAKDFVDRKDRKALKVMSRPIQLAVCATNVALQDATLNPAQVDPTRLGVVYGAGLIASELEELGPAAKLTTNGQPYFVDLEKWGREGLAAMPPLWMLKYLPNMLACHVSILHNAQGPNNSITQGDAASLLALGEAWRILRRGLADVMLTGGGDSRLNPLSMSRLCLFAPLTRRNEAPEEASRPFDRERDGLVPGEGAAIFVLETSEHAQRRGAKIYGEVVGFASGFDSRRSGAVLAQVIDQALKSAGVRAEAIDHINAHGYSTPKEDAWEAAGLAEVFGRNNSRVPVFAAKSYWGNLGAAGSVAELAISLLAWRHGLLPPTRNYRQADPQCPVHVLAGRWHEPHKDYFLKVAIGERGHCAAAVIRRWR